MVDVKQAIDHAVQYLGKLFPNVATNQVLLEEVEISGDDWLVTLSFPDPVSYIAKRMYKIFRVDRNTGQVLSMKIRILENA